MRPSYKKWRAAPKGARPFQIALFIRTENGRTVECTADAATSKMQDVALKLLTALCEKET